MALNEQCNRIHGDISLKTVQFYKPEKKGSRDFIGVLFDHDLDQPSAARREPGWWMENRKEENGKEDTDSVDDKQKDLNKSRSSETSSSSHSNML